eukprot:gnl/TRDRNA2_/TRDRNA2_57952_c0_seq1.p1 gnl/TRDRNA2_/TRDRNA2_57952_c0~~gnl/TRDRNA2_/TRDRNA2_57952_c0_seq1.p1  ORF type:complete len:137 (-),score=46.27 gnl/TRDRNA2_/TRDRNA2_57952_c0_seq1:68-478(-)
MQMAMRCLLVLALGLFAMVDSKTPAKGSMYKGTLKMKNPNAEGDNKHFEDIIIEVEFVSDTGGKWRDVVDSDLSEQFFEAKTDGDKVIIKDSETELSGACDSAGVIVGDVVHKGLSGGGTFTLTPTEEKKAEKNEL